MLRVTGLHGTNRGSGELLAVYNRSDNVNGNVAGLTSPASGLEEDPTTFMVPYMELLKRIIRAEREYAHAENHLRATNKRLSTVDDELSVGMGYLEKSNTVRVVPGIADDLYSMPTILGSTGSKPMSPGSSIGNGGPGSISSASLGPVVEESLLSLLCALGVLHSPENQLLVLPSDSEALRKVISLTYVKKLPWGQLSYDSATQPGVAAAPLDKSSSSNTYESSSFLTSTAGSPIWHSRLISYFQDQPNSLRSCEELPWHLQICRQWSALKNVVSDLKTFDLMYTCGLRDELLTYWLVLSTGPLHTSDAAHQAYVASSRYNLSESERILVDLDAAYALGLTDKGSSILTQ